MTFNLSSLATFVVVARHLSFTKAAAELFLSQGAVSIQIKQLEAELGFDLFYRRTRKIVLTPKGESLLEVVIPGLQQIQRRAEALRSTEGKRHITVSMLSSFAAKWFIPRISLFQSNHPEIDLRIHTSDQNVDFMADKIDCAIRLGRGKYRGLKSFHLMDEYFFPVCSPDYLEKTLPLKSPEEIQFYTLLHDTIGDDRFNVNWNEWGKEMGVGHLNFNRGTRVHQADYAIQLAIANQGIALGRLSLVANDIKAGLLKPVFEKQIKATYSYYLVYPEEYQQNRNIEIFKVWLIEQIN